MRAFWCLILVASFSLAGGCDAFRAQRVHYVYSTKEPTGASYRQRMNFFVGGLGSGEVDTSRCGANGAAKITTYFSGMDNFLGLVTLWVYVPRHVDVVCAGGS